MQVDIMSRKRELTQHVFQMFHVLLCLLVDGSHRSGTSSVWSFSVILLVVVVSAIPSGAERLHLMVEKLLGTEMISFSNFKFA